MILGKVFLMLRRIKLYHEQKNHCLSLNFFNFLWFLADVFLDNKIYVINALAPDGVTKIHFFVNVS